MAHGAGAGRRSSGGAVSIANESVQISVSIGSNSYMTGMWASVIGGISGPR